MGLYIIIIIYIITPSCRLDYQLPVVYTSRAKYYQQKAESIIVQLKIMYGRLNLYLFSCVGSKLICIAYHTILQPPAKISRKTALQPSSLKYTTTLSLLNASGSGQHIVLYLRA